MKFRGIRIEPCQSAGVKFANIAPALRHQRTKSSEILGPNRHDRTSSNKCSHLIMPRSWVRFPPALLRRFSGDRRFQHLQRESPTWQRSSLPSACAVTIDDCRRRTGRRRERHADRDALIEYEPCDLAVRDDVFSGP